MMKTSVAFRILLVAAAVLLFVRPYYSQDSPGLVCHDKAPRFTARFGASPIELHDSPVATFGIFPWESSGEVTIHTGFEVRWVEVKPLSAGIAATIDGSHREVRFRLNALVPATVEFNDDLGHVLHLFPYHASAGPESNEAHTRVFGPGMHRAGTIELKTGDSVYLAPGAWVSGKIRARHAQHIRIYGAGVLDGSDNADAEDFYQGAGPLYVEDVQDLRLEGVTFFNSKSWTVHLREVSDATIDGIRVLNPGAQNGDDGIDLVSSNHVTVRNVFVRTNDDCVVVKNLADRETGNIVVQHSVLWNMPNGGNGVEIGFETRAHRTHDVLFEDLDMIHVERGAAISIHNADSAVVEKIEYRNIRVEDVRRKLLDIAVLYAAYGPDRPAREEEIRARMDEGGVWDANLCYKPEEREALRKQRGSIRGIVVSNLQVTAGALPYSIIAGYDAGHAVSDVAIRGLRYQGRELRDAAAAKLVVEYAQGVRIE